ncbi:hypothetical protein [Mucilaginibacter sp.]
MKKLIIALLFSGLIFTMGTEIASAQIQLKEVDISGTPSKSIVTKKVSESFNRLFKGAVAPAWFTIDKGYLVKFIMDDQKNKAVFTKNGQLVYLLAFGNEKQMPRDIRTAVKSKYFDYDITSTVKVNIDDKTIWLVNLEDAKQLIMLRVDEDGVVDVADEVTKQKPGKLYAGLDN